jgi:hypothetical protein
MANQHKPHRIRNLRGNISIIYNKRGKYHQKSGNQGNFVQIEREGDCGRE